ncbi:hypothetical protein D5086_004931 [Populus alba]|uniref:Uncharacterized protein n=1 Tax=Populus alba TaxID=43335 RepID=A0ACC4CS97_POPAL
MSPKTNFLFVVSNQPWPIPIHDYLPTVLCLEDYIKSRNDTACEWWGLIALSSTLSLDYGERETFSILMVLCCWKLLVWLEGTYGAAGGKVAVLSNRGDAVGGAVMTPQRKPVLPWLLRIEELRIVVSTNDAERNTTTHDEGWP